MYIANIFSFMQRPESNTAHNPLSIENLEADRDPRWLFVIRGVCASLLHTHADTGIYGSGSAQPFGT